MANSTIAAYSGGALPGAIGICRISGDKAFEIMDTLFAPKNEKKMSDCEHSKMIYGDVIDFDGCALDICLAVCYKGPHTYTGENSAEIFCHGSAAIVSQILARAFALGATPAEAGEFTQRGFLAGKLDLTGVEAVGDLIYAKSAAAAKNAASLLKGGVSEKIRGIHAKIMDIITHFFAVCDYPDEDLDEFLLARATKELTDAQHELDALYAGYARGQTLVSGVPVTILGKPNVGKSSLLNALVGYDRAIVTSEAGTTRDVITQEITCGGVLLQISDTAGVRSATSEAEKIGVEKAIASAENSEFLICVFDGSRELDEQDKKIINIAQGKSEQGKIVAIINKTDLGCRNRAEIAGKFATVFDVCANTSTGIEKLAAWLAKLAPQNNAADALITSARQAGLLREAAENCANAAKSAQGGQTADAFLSDAERAARLLSEVLGESVSDDIVHGIFSRFCVGK